MKSKLLFLLAPLTSLITASVAQPLPTEQPITTYPQLMSHSEYKLYESSREINGEQDRIQYRVLQTLKALQKDPVGNPHAFDQPFDTVLRLIGNMRIKGAIPKLVNLIDFELDPATIPLIRDPRGFEFYPGAQAFAGVADKNDIDSLFRRLERSPSDEKHLRIYAWILTEVHGLRLARWEVEGRLSDETQLLIKRKETDSDFKTNLQKMEELLETESPSYLILAPKKPEPPVEKTATPAEPAKTVN